MLQFVDEPQEVVHKPMAIVVCKPTQRVDCIILVRRLAGVQTHWFGGHTIACCGTDNCPACQANYAPVWKGFFVAFGMMSGDKALVMVTEGAYEALGQHVQHKNGLLGLRVVITRQGRRVNSPMCLGTFGRVPDYPEYPQAALFQMVSRIFAANAIEQPHSPA